MGEPQSAEAQAAAQALMHDAKAYIGTSLSVQLCAEGEVERSQGKAKRVLDLRNAEGFMRADCQPTTDPLHRVRSSPSAIA